MIRYVQNKSPQYSTIEQYLQDSVKTNTFTNNGPGKRSLEKTLHKLLGLDSDYSVVCVSNGTAALYIACVLAEIEIGGPISWATPAFNFPAATVNKLDTTIYDIYPDTYTLPLDIDSQGYILPTLFGTIPNLDGWLDKCEAEDRVLILDNASSPLSSFSRHGNSRAKNICQYGLMSIGSLHHTKYLGFGEGGFIVLPAKYEAQANALANFGFQDSRIHNPVATNAKMSDISAAFIHQHIHSYNIDDHLGIQKQFKDAIDKLDGVELFNYSDGVVYGNLPLLFNRSIDHLVFRDVGIEANKYYRPLKSLPNSDDLFSRIVNLPLHAGLTQYEIEIILKKVEYEAKIS